MLADDPTCFYCQRAEGRDARDLLLECACFECSRNIHMSCLTPRLEQVRSTGVVVARAARRQRGSLGEVSCRAWRGVVRYPSVTAASNLEARARARAIGLAGRSGKDSRLVDPPKARTRRLGLANDSVGVYVPGAVVVSTGQSKVPAPL